MAAPRASSSSAVAAALCRFSSRSRSAVSGVRSWWEASATNSRCSARSWSRRRAMVFMVSPRTAISGGAEGSGASGARSPVAKRAAAESSVRERPGDGPRDRPADARHGDQHHHGDGDEGRPVAAHECVRGLLVERQTDGAVHDSRGGRGHGHVEQVGLQGLGVARADGRVAVQRRLHLRTRREVPTRRPGGVDDRDARLVDDDDADAGALRVAGRRRGVELVAGLERLFVVAGEHGGVALDVVLEPPHLPLLVEDRQRDLEDDQDDEGGEQVAEQQPAGHGAPVASARRKPTPRTVSMSSGDNFLRSEAMWTSSVLVEPHQFWSQTSSMSCLRVSTAPGSLAR